MHIRMTALFIVLACLVPHGDASAQVRPEQRPLPLPKRTPKVPASQTTPPQTQVQGDSSTVEGEAEVVYLAPEDAPDMPAPPRRYKAPGGFSGHAWGEPRARFDKLPQQPLQVRASWTRGMERQPELYCMQGVIGSTCSLQDVLNSMANRLEGGGFHVLSEYKVEQQGFRFGNSDVLLFPVIYQFCANWDATRREVPENFDAINRFCGMRLLFESESRVQLRGLPRDHVTQYELVLAELIAEYGKPAGFLKRGQVAIETVDGTSEPQLEEDRKFSTWRWCPAADRALATRCDASIVLSLEPESGRGVVLFSTPALWAYAYARENGGFKGDPLFAVMHARPPARRHRINDHAPQ
jgi:hypothetical protein